MFRSVRTRVRRLHLAPVMKIRLGADQHEDGFFFGKALTMLQLFAYVGEGFHVGDVVHENNACPTPKEGVSNGKLRIMPRRVDHLDVCYGAIVQGHLSAP